MVLALGSVLGFGPCLARHCHRYCFIPLASCGKRAWKYTLFFAQPLSHSRTVFLFVLSRTASAKAASAKAASAKAASTAHRWLAQPQQNSSVQNSSDQRDASGATSKTLETIPSPPPSPSSAPSPSEAVDAKGSNELGHEDGHTGTVSQGFHEFLHDLMSGDRDNFSGGPGEFNQLKTSKIKQALSALSVGSMAGISCPWSVAICINFFSRAIIDAIKQALFFYGDMISVAFDLILIMTSFQYLGTVLFSFAPGALSFDINSPVRLIFSSFPGILPPIPGLDHLLLDVLLPSLYPGLEWLIALPSIFLNIPVMAQCRGMYGALSFVLYMLTVVPLTWFIEFDWMTRLKLHPGFREPPWKANRDICSPPKITHIPKFTRRIVDAMKRFESRPRGLCEQVCLRFCANREQEQSDHTTEMLEKEVTSKLKDMDSVDMVLGGLYKPVHFCALNTLGKALWNRSCGLKWRKIGDEKPSAGEELTNEGLESSLASKTEFTKEQWAAFGITALRMDHFIKSGASYFRPADRCSAFDFKMLLRGILKRRLSTMIKRHTGGKTPWFGKDIDEDIDEDIDKDLEQAWEIVAVEDEPSPEKFIVSVVVYLVNANAGS